MTFPVDPLDVTIEAAFGADRTAAPGTWTWTDLTGRWHPRSDLRVRTGRREGARQAEAGEITFTLGNTDGQVTPEDPRSQWWPHVDEGLPVRVTLDPGVGDPQVFGGLVASLRPHWPGGSARLARVDVVASGPLRATGRGEQPLPSALRRHITGSNVDPITYWALNGGALSTAGLLTAGRGGSMRPLTGAVKWSAGQVAPWLEPGVAIEGDATIVGSVTGSMSQAPAASIVTHMRQADGGGDGPSTLDIRGNTDGGGSRWLITFTPATSDIQVQLLHDGASVFVDNVTYEPLFNNDPHWLSFAAFASAGNISWQLTVDGTIAISGVEVSQPLTGVGAVRLSYAPGAGGGTPLALSHVAVWDESLSGLAPAAAGWTGEHAGFRALRICAENDIPFELIGDTDDTELMGPQYPAALVDVLRACEAADDGILSEAGFGYRYRTRASRYNQSPALTIDAALRQLGRAFEPIRDDQRVRNEWTVSRRDGGEATALDIADQVRRGRKDDSLDVEAPDDMRLADRANWELTRSVGRTLRYPVLEIPLHAAPGLVEQAAAARLGDRVQVLNPPTQHPPGPVDQVIEGIEHTVRGRRHWTWQAVVTPAAPWTVGAYAGDAEEPDPDTPMRYSPYDSRTSAAFEVGTDTSLEVTDQTGGNDLWSTVADFPFDIRVRGCRLRVTAISAPTGAAQAMTVQLTPVNTTTGVSIDAGEQVELWQPARYAL
jgi:hypothetical protein